MYLTIPIDLFSAAHKHFELTNLVPEFIMLDSNEWQAACPLPVDDCSSYRYYLHYRPGLPMRYFAGEAYAGTKSDWRPFTSVDEATAFTSDFFNLEATPSQ